MSRFRRVLVLGSGALKIGEAGSSTIPQPGDQGAEGRGVATVLVNPTSPPSRLPSALPIGPYFLPVTPEFVARVIERERLDAIAISFGGQRPRTGLALARQGVLERYGVAVLGTLIRTIEETEDRALHARLGEIGVEVPRRPRRPEEAVPLRKANADPAMVRGGRWRWRAGCWTKRSSSSGRRLSPTARRCWSRSTSSAGRSSNTRLCATRFDNCIVVCNMENLDLMGVHTGESIVVAPARRHEPRVPHAEWRSPSEPCVTSAWSASATSSSRFAPGLVLTARSRSTPGSRARRCRLQGDRLSAGLHRGQARPRP